MEAVRQDGMALCYASNELKADREIVLEAVRQNDSALRYASKELQVDREFVSKRARQNGFDRSRGNRGSRGCPVRDERIAAVPSCSFDISAGHHRAFNVVESATGR